MNYVTLFFLSKSPRKHHEIKREIEKEKKMQIVIFQF